MKTTANPPRETVLNGVNVTRLVQTIGAIKKNTEIAEFKFRARNEWNIGGHNQATIEGFYGACQEMAHKQPFTFDADEPAVLLGEDNGANPVEFVLAGLSGCMTTTLAYHAASRGLKIDEISSEYEGDIDLRGLMDIDPKVRPGYREIRVKFKVKGDVDEATVQELIRKSPVFDTLASPVMIKVEVETERPRVREPRS
ncbi:MAG: OsmC family protein [Verrucomicrobia subdivision 3 bacterium]|nr:OsmC family protein [Limisphaerales bacterium]